VEARSNTSTVILRVVGGDEKGSIKCEKENMFAGPKVLGPEKDCSGEGQKHMQVLSSERVLDKNKTVTVKE
jgi:hypothetical protein